MFSESFVRNVRNARHSMTVAGIPASQIEKAIREMIDHESYRLIDNFTNGVACRAQRLRAYVGDNGKSDSDLAKDMEFMPEKRNNGSAVIA